MSTRIDELTKTATAALGALRGVALGEPFRLNFDATVTAATALCDAVRPALFPPVEPLGADMVADLDQYLDVLPLGAAFGPALAQLHGECVVDYPALARAIRGAVIRRRLGDQLVGFQTTAAAQLAGTGDAAAVAFVAGLDIMAQASAIKDQHDAHSREELDRIANEQRAADAAIAATGKEHRERLAQFFGARHSTVFQVGGNTYTGRNVAAMLCGELGRDTEGNSWRDLNLAGNPGIDLIEKAMRQQMAYEAAA